MAYFRIFFALFAIQLAILGDATRHIKFSHVYFLIYRHGARSPSKAFPTDAYGKSVWAQGWKQLTKTGMQQQYELGQFLRDHYSNFLSPEYVKKEIYVRSSNVNRALQSALANLAGLYPPSENQTWNKNIAWQPIPVHCDRDKDNDRLLKPTSVECPFYDEIDKAGKEILMNYYDEKYATLFRFLEDKTGLDHVDVKTAAGLYSPLISEKTEGLVPPLWSNDQWNNGTTIFDLIKMMKTVYRVDDFKNAVKAKALGGYLLHDIIERMKSISNNNLKKPKKMVMYSTHDGTVSALMYNIGIGNNILVPFASCVMIEMYYDDYKNKYDVEILYRNDTSVAPFNLRIPGCSIPCELDSMTSLLGDHTLSEDEAKIFCLQVYSSSTFIQFPTIHRVYCITLVYFYVIAVLYID